MMLFLISAVFLACVLLLFVLAWTDHKYYLLPNAYNLALLLGFAGFHYLTGWTLVSVLSAVIGAIVGGGFLTIVRIIANRVMAEDDTVGLGDVKFMIAAGFGVGIPNVLLVLSVGSLFGILHGAILREHQRRKTGKKTSLMHVNVPAGVGLCLATLLIMLIDFGPWWEAYL